MEEPAYYMAQGDGFKAADALARQIRLAAAQGGEYGPLALRLKWMFCLLSIDGGHPEAAFALAGENLPGIIKTYGEHAAETANFKSTRLFAASAMSDGKSAATAAVDVLPLYTEQRQPLEQSTILFNWMSAALSMGEKEKAAFLAKLSAGMISYARAEDDSMSAYVPFPDFGALADDFASLGIKLDKTALAQLSAAPNAPGDTAYNKARTLMSGPEAALYKQYGQCAAALNMAGADGTNAQKEAARNAFKDWLAQVDKTWPAKQQRE